GVIFADRFNCDGTGFQKTLRHSISFSIPSARYTDKADGNWQSQRDSIAKPTCRKSGSGPAITALRKRSSRTKLTRVQLNSQRFVDVLTDISAIRSLLEHAGRLGGVNFYPLRQANARSQIQGFLDTALGFSFFAHANNVTSLDQHGSDVSGVTVDFDCTVVHQLTCFCTCRAKAHAVNHVVQTRFQQLNQRFTGVA